MNIFRFSTIVFLKVAKCPAQAAATLRALTVFLSSFIALAEAQALLHMMVT